MSSDDSGSDTAQTQELPTTTGQLYREPETVDAPRLPRPNPARVLSAKFTAEHRSFRRPSQTLKRNRTWADQLNGWGRTQNQVELLGESSSDSGEDDDNDDEEILADEPAPQGGDDGNANVTRNTETRSPINQKRRRTRFKDVNYASKVLKRADVLADRGRSCARDGRLRISINQVVNTGYLAKSVKAGVRHHVRHEAAENRFAAERRPTSDSVESSLRPEIIPPKLNIAIIVIGSRGDIQPFLKIGKILRSDYGHRVRIATHAQFRDFVERDAGLEFFPVGGDPSELMAFMVKNPGLIPSLQTIKSGDIGKRRASMYEMFQGMWEACASSTNDDNQPPFVADAIIANPPSFAHLHIAERLGCPLHIIFTFPYTPTTHFPHPLANIKQSNVEKAYTNFMSYPLVEMMTWQGLGDLVNKFRVQTLGLDPVSTLWAPGMLYRLEVHHTYLWSPSLVPKPGDWGPQVDIAGFVFLDLGSDFEPPQELVDFLEAGPAPVYIGFGSIVVDDPNAFTELIFKAVEEAGVRALVSKGWGGIGGGELDVPENIHLLDNTPHDWLFPRCSAVVHHGGAGTTAIGLKCAKPTMIVPFFGDQPFWGDMVARARAGAFECIPYKKLTVEKFVSGIQQCLADEAKDNVAKFAKKIEQEGDGALNAVRSIHQALPLSGGRSLRCSILEERVAVWRLKRTPFRFSAIAAELLVSHGKVLWKSLEPCRHKEWNDFEGPGEPVTGVSTAALRGAADIALGVGSVPFEMAKSARKRRRHQERKRIRRKKLEGMRKEQVAEPDSTPSQDHNEPVQDGQEESEAPEKGELPKGRQKPLRTRTQSTLSADPSEPLHRELANEARDGMKISSKAVFKLPMELPLAIAQGFHNAPRLYGDETVRRPRRITGFASGLNAGKEEFVFGMTDAFVGLYQLPALGLKNHGVLGCLEGIGMGIGGLVLKPISAVVSPWPYAMKGVQMEWRARKREPGTNTWIESARMMQGKMELRELERAAAQAKNADSEENSLAAQEDAKQARTTLEDLEKRVNHGWSVVAKLLQFKEDAVQRSWFARVKMQQERKKWRDAAALESVATAETALEARNNGIPIDQALRDFRRQRDSSIPPPSLQAARPGAESVRQKQARSGCQTIPEGGGNERTASASMNGTLDEKQDTQGASTNAKDFALSAGSETVN